MSNCEKATGQKVGKTVFITTESGAKAFIPIERLCEAVRRYNLCLEVDGKPYKC